MKLLRYGSKGQERPAIVAEDGTLRDLSALLRDIDGSIFSPETQQRLRELEVDALPKVQGNPRIGPCIAEVGKSICVGLNDSDHAAESGMAGPSEPVIFMKTTSSIMGPDDDIIIPRGSKKTDWEVELGVVIGRTAKYVVERDALSYVGGYRIVNDLSERAFQLQGTEARVVDC